MPGEVESTRRGVLNFEECLRKSAEVAPSRAGAANRLGVPTSTVSRRVAQLEEELGIATSIDFGSSDFFTQLITEYSLKFREVDIEVEIANRMVDLLEEGFDVAFRIHSEAMRDRDDLVVRRLAQLSIDLYANRDYMEHHGPLKTFEELVDRPIVAHTTAQRDTWPAAPSTVANDYGPLAAILARGVGIGALPIFVAIPYLKRGELVSVDVPYSAPSANLSLVWLQSRHLAPRVRAFIDSAAELADATDWSV